MEISVFYERIFSRLDDMHPVRALDTVHALLISHSVH